MDAEVLGTLGGQLLVAFDHLLLGHAVLGIAGLVHDLKALFRCVYETVVGLRPGEKLYEELMMDEEQDKMRRTQHNKILVASPRSIDLAEFDGQLQELAAAAEHNDEGVVQQLAKMIPTFTPTCLLYTSRCV